MYIFQFALQWIAAGAVAHDHGTGNLQSFQGRVQRQFADLRERFRKRSARGQDRVGAVHIK